MAGWTRSRFRRFLLHVIDVYKRQVCEPYLMQMGFLSRTPRGRCVTDAAYRHLGMQPPQRAVSQPAQDTPRQQSFDDLEG